MKQRFLKTALNIATSDRTTFFQISGVD